MKKNKDFTYYGKKRLQVQRALNFLKEDKTNYEFWIIVPLSLYALLYDIKSNFGFDFTFTFGILSSIFFLYLSWLILSFISVIILGFLDKYYFKKRKELFEKYLAEKGTNHFVTGE